MSNFIKKAAAGGLMLTSAASLAGMGYYVHEGSQESDESIAASAEVYEINNRLSNGEVPPEEQESLEQQRDSYSDIMFEDYTRRDMYSTVYGLSLFITFAASGIGASVVAANVISDRQSKQID